MFILEDKSNLFTSFREETEQTIGGAKVHHKPSKSLFETSQQQQPININVESNEYYYDDDGFDDPNLSDAAKKDKRKLTLGRKSFPTSLSIQNESADISQIDQNIVKVK